MLFFPASRRRRYIARSVGLNREADNAAMYNDVRTPLRPPKIERSPRLVPLSARPGRQPGQGRDPLAREGAKLRQVAQQGVRGLVADPWDRA